MGRIAKDLQGKRFGRLLVIERAGSVYRKNSNICRDALWRCLCDCGKERKVISGNLTRGTSNSCGCLRDDGRKKYASQTNREIYSKEYRIWAQMIHRCKNKNAIYYGGRGIKVCERWKGSYKSFLEDMGRCPNGCSIDRINVNGNYDPSNCRWTTATIQSRNQRVGINNKTGVRGVGRTANGRFRVSIHINRKQINIGTFKNISDAIVARKDAELKYWS